MKISEYNEMMAYLLRPRQKFANGGNVLPKNIRLTPQGQYRFSSQAGNKNFSKIFPKGTKLEDVLAFRDGYLKQFGIEEGQLRPVNPDRGNYVGVKGEKHIKFNGITYQVAVQRMKDGKMVTEKPFYTSSLKEAKEVRDERVAKSPPKVEKGVVKPDREKIQRKIDKRRFIQKTKEGRSGIKFLASKGYQVHHLLPLTLAGPDTNTRDLAVISAQMNREMAQFDKPIKNLTEEAFLLDYNGDRKNSFKRLDEINKELNDIVKKGVKKLGPKYKGLIGFNEIIPIPDENGQIFSLDFKPTGIDFKKSIAKDIKVPEKVKNISTSELQKLVSEAPTFSANPFLDPRNILTGLGDVARVLSTPTIAATFAGTTIKENLDKGESLPEALADPMVGVELLYPELGRRTVGQLAPRGAGILSTIGRVAANPFFGAARAFTPIGAGLTAVGLAKDAYERYQELEAMSPEQREELARERDEFSFGEFGGA